jgi:hypothetical protein
MPPSHGARPPTSRAAPRLNAPLDRAKPAPSRSFRASRVQMGSSPYQHGDRACSGRGVVGALDRKRSCDAEAWESELALATPSSAYE